jgi:hypothetical protein
MYRLMLVSQINAFFLSFIYRLFTAINVPHAVCEDMRPVITEVNQRVNILICHVLLTVSKLSFQIFLTFPLTYLKLLVLE